MNTNNGKLLFSNNSLAS